MKANYLWVAVAGMMLATGVWAAPKEEAAQAVYPTAVFAFEERGEGVKGYGEKVSDILFATLATDPNLMLVDRKDMKKVLDEAAINLSGMVTPGQATQVGQLTGAKILVTGSVIEIDKLMYVVAKIIGTETSRVFGESVNGKTSDNLAPMVEALAKKTAATINGQADKLVAKEVKIEDRLAALKKALGDAKRPAVLIRIEERHIGQGTIDPAAETEITLFCRESGFEVVDPKTAPSKQADIRIEGSGFSEFATRRGDLVSVKARLEVKVVDPSTDKIIAVDRQTAMEVDLTEQIAGKKALEKAAAAIAERLLPKLIKK